MAPINDLITLMYVCEGIAKDVHYGASGESFYAVHLLADKVDFSDKRDELIETFYLASKTPVPTTAEFYRDAADLSASLEGATALHKLSDALGKVIYAVEEAKRVARPLAGVHAVLDSISQDALVVLGLVNRTLS